MTKNEALLELYESLDIKKLSDEVRKNGFTYRQMVRSKHKFLYAQHNSAGSIVGYEVFFNHIKPWRAMKEAWAKRRNEKTDYSNEPEYYETFPSDEEFGKRAWNYKTLGDAMVAFDTK